MNAEQNGMKSVFNINAIVRFIKSYIVVDEAFGYQESLFKIIILVFAKVVLFNASL